jgi:hypothetical protein
MRFTYSSLRSTIASSLWEPHLRRAYDESMIFLPQALVKLKSITHNGVTIKQDT